MMSEYTPHFAPAVVLVFLGTVFMTGIALLVFLYGAMRRSEFFATLGATTAAVIVTGYGLVLGSASAISTEKVLPLGGWKYFCEVDCHIAFSVQSAFSTPALGRGSQQTFAKGQFVIVRLKTWFDERTISPHRGNGPLQTGDRMVVLVDAAGHTYFESPEGRRALRLIEGASTPLDEPLRPGESFATSFVFDVPKDASDLRLLVTDKPNVWLPKLIIDHEDSFLHKKIFLGLEPNAGAVRSSAVVR